MPQQGRSRGSARERLLRAADELFYAQGIASTGVDAVVGRAEVALASLYKSFGNKDNLVAAYLAERDRRWRELWEAEISRADSAEGRLLAVFDALQVWRETIGMNHGCAMSAAAVQITDPAHPAVKVITEQKAWMLRRLGELAADYGVSAPAQVAEQLLITYEGVLARASLGDLAAIDSGRQLAQARLMVETLVAPRE
ncbi:TetR/AcrR family transcriptional regulator [Micromonospora sp. FIMYZ51]|uniref:TetR/AcrR family transcriptional regulator n=1 Tax=Micromonospora sp. FIMYZ51 TaxID=3051832 RepID=UPI00311E7BEE